MITRVIKRNGDIVKFDIEKPIAAMEKALNAVSEPIASTRLRLLLTYTLARISDEQQLTVLNIEEVQDICEDVLIESSSKGAARAFIRYRDERAKNRIDASGPLADYIYWSKYKGEHDTCWSDTVVRTMTMHSRKYAMNDGNLCRTIYLAFDTVRQKKHLPSMRSLQFGGFPIESNHARMFNCSFCPIADIEFFYNLYFLLLSGCGVGYSVERQYIEKLPVLKEPRTDAIFTHVIEDSIQGWAAALYALLGSYTHDGWYYVEFDYSAIRPNGSPISSGGSAPGHIPLKIALERIRTILDSAIGRQLRSFELHRMCCIVAESVLAGGIRRSSLICLFNPDDEEMFNCKTGEWWVKYPELAMANNSARFHYHSREFDGDYYLLEDYWDKIKNAARQYGEPGYFVNPHDGVGTNPCGEILLDSNSPHGYGFAFCNLTEINLADCKDENEFREVAIASARIGVLQSGFNNMAKASGISNETMDWIAKNRPLLGVSLTGICDNVSLLGRLNSVATEITEVAREFAISLGLKPAERVTCVKPSGTASLLLGGVSSGIHPHHSEFYIRRVTANRNEKVFKRFAEVNPHAVREKPNGDFIIEFPVHSRSKATLDKMTCYDQLAMIRRVYDNWIVPGSKYSEIGTHNVSATVVVSDDEWDNLEYPPNLPAVSFLSRIGDKTYPFAPREACRTEPEMEYWRSLASKMKPVDYPQNAHFEDKGAACEGPKCEI